MEEKARLLPLAATPPPPAYSSSSGGPRAFPRGRQTIRPSRLIKIVAVGCLFFIVLSQWAQVWRVETSAPRLSVDKLSADYATCHRLRSKPEDPIGPGRDKNARYIEGGRPTLIKNATIWVGEPAEGTSEADARAGLGWEWIHGDVLLEKGLIKAVEAEISSDTLPEGTVVYDAKGRQLTSGIIDMHSHAGVYSLPGLDGRADGNEWSDNITPWARAIDAIWPLDPQIQVIKSGGVTTSLVLPGSGNNIGGEAYVIKHAVGVADGRKELGANDMLADPDRNWRYMKMACGENAIRIHGGIGSLPGSRMGESYEFRHAFEQASELNRQQDDWCAKADQIGAENMDSYLPQPISWEALAAALRGQVHINIHCYTIPDLEAMVDHTNEFSFPVRAFHHAHQTFLVPEILRRTWGGRAPSSAIFADNMYYKTEAYVASEFAGKYLYDEGLTPIYVSDNPVLNAQHVLFEAAKGYRYGLPYHAALASVTTAPADDLGLGKRLGKVKPGFDADIVVWDSDPLSVGATPVQVWIDGTAQFKDPFVLSKPPSGPIQPDTKLSHVVEEPTVVPNALFSGITKVLLSDRPPYETSDNKFNVAISNGKISCIGICQAEFAAAAAAGVKTIELDNGYLTNAFVGVGGSLGLNEIDGEDMTDNGLNVGRFTRASDGLLLESKKLWAAYKYGVTRAISAPKLNGQASYHGTSVGFVTTAHTSLDSDAIFAEDLAAHYTLNLNVRAEMSYSAAFGILREKLLSAGRSEGGALPYSEDEYLLGVVNGTIPLALNIQSADGIAAALKLKKQIDAYGWSANGLKVVIVGGSEAYLVADELAEAGAGVILTPLQHMNDPWDSRRALSGAPLTNGTNIDRLLDAGVTVGIGLLEDWEVRDLGLAAGTALRNGEGRLTEKTALDLVGKNILDIFGVVLPAAEESGHFLVSEGSPMEIGSRVKAVGSGNGQVAVFV